MLSISIINAVVYALCTILSLLITYFFIGKPEEIFRCSAVRRLIRLFESKNRTVTMSTRPLKCDANRKLVRRTENFLSILIILVSLLYYAYHKREIEKSTSQKILEKFYLFYIFLKQLGCNILGIVCEITPV